MGLFENNELKSLTINIIEVSKILNNENNSK